MALPNSAPITFGHPFAAGDMPRYSALRATVGGTAVAAQIDPKSYWQDGSVRHAVVSLKTPAGAGSTADVTLRPVGARRPPSATVAQRVQSALTAGYDVDVVFSGGLSGTYTVQSLLQSALTAGTFDVWLHGDVCTEVRVTAWPTPSFGLTADVRIYDGGLVRTDLLFHNDNIRYIGGEMYAPQSVTYSAVIRVGGSTVYTFPSKLHIQAQWWRKKVWSGGTEPAARPLFNFDYWQINAKALPETDLDIGDCSAAAVSYLDGMASVIGPLERGPFTKYFPTTGGTARRGMFVADQALYLASQDKDSFNLTNVCGEASLSVPWHFRDAGTGKWISPRDWPTLWVGTWPTQPNPPYASGNDWVRDGSGNFADGWHVDPDHRTNTNYVAYLISGDRVMHDDLMHDAMSLSFYSNSPRKTDENCFMNGQGRGFAWGMRTILFALYATSDRETKSLFEYWLERNHHWFFNGWQIDTMWAGRDWKGIFYINKGDWQYATWQEDFVMEAMTFGMSFGAPRCDDWVNYLKGYSVGRANSEHLGYTPFWSSFYYSKFSDGTGAHGDFNNGTPKTFSTNSWVDLQAVHLTGQYTLTLPTEIYENFPGGYGDHARAAGALVWNRFQDIKALRLFCFTAWRNWMRTTHFNDANLKSNPHHAMTPILPDGTRLGFLGNRIIDPLSAGTITGDAGVNQIILAYPGSTVNAGGGSNLIYVYEGTNTLNGSPDGSDVIIGGKGADIINPGPGNNWVQCGYEGTTRVDFGASSGGADRIYNFSQTRGDRLNVLPSLSSAQASALIAAATTDADGNAVLHLASGKDVTMVDHAPGALATNWFVLS